jgi:hypothetical protein
MTNILNIAQSRSFVYNKNLFVAFSHFLTEKQVEDYFNIMAQGVKYNIVYKYNNDNKIIGAEAYCKEAEGVVPMLLSKIYTLSDVDSELQKTFSNVNPRENVTPIITKLNNIIKDLGVNFVYIDGEPRVVANFHAYNLITNNVFCIKSTNERVAVETTNPDGSITTIRSFVHAAWMPYIEQELFDYFNESYV